MLAPPQGWRHSRHIVLVVPGDYLDRQLHSRRRSALSPGAVAFVLADIVAEGIETERDSPAGSHIVGLDIVVATKRIAVAVNIVVEDIAVAQEDIVAAERCKAAESNLAAHSHPEELLVVGMAVGKRQQPH